MKRKEKKLITFAENFFEGIQTHDPTPKKFSALDRTFDYVPGPVEEKIKIRGKRVRSLRICKDPHTNLGKMIERFRNSFVEEVEVTNLHHLDIKGGCLGCIQCGYDYQCSLRGSG